MPDYDQLHAETEDGERTLTRLLQLREVFAASGVPRRSLDDTLLIASWNLREFDSPSYGARTSEAMYYIAEIIDQFDLVAIQEVRRSLERLEELLDLLGPHWEYVVSDVTEGTKGNRERLAFLFDSRKLKLSGLAGEIVLPPRKGAPVDQIDRTPYLVGFQAGWTKLALVTAHMRWGTSKANDPDRIDEIDGLARFLHKRASDKRGSMKNMIVLGDFNVFDPGDLTMKALTDQGFVVPEALVGARSNWTRTRAYDQIAYHVDEDRIDWTGAGGVLDFRSCLYRDEDQHLYIRDMGDAYTTKSSGQTRTESEQRRYYRQWRTYQISDHFPIWAELKIDFSRRFLERRLTGDR